MNSVIKELSIDVSERKLIAAVTAKQNDSNSRYLKITVTHEGKPLSFDKSSVITANGLREDGQSSAFFCKTDKNGNILMLLNSWFLEVSGTVRCDLSVFDAKMLQKLTTLYFYIDVEEATYGDDEISSDPKADVLSELLNKGETLCTQVENLNKKAVNYSDEAQQSALAAQAAQSGAEAAKAEAESAAADIKGKLADYETHEEAQELYEQLQNEMWNGFYPRIAIDNLFSNVYAKSEVDEKDTALNDSFATATEQLWLEVVKKASNAALAALKRKALPRGLVSGYPASLTNALADETLIGLKVYGNHGKNLLSYPFYGKTTTINGVTFTASGDGSVTANGTAASDALYLIKSRRLFTLEPKKYALSGCPTGGGDSSYRIRLVAYNGETGVKEFKDNGSGTVFDLSSLTFTGANVYICIYKGAAVNNLVFKPQLEEGDAVSEYEPYKTVGDLDSASGKYLLPVCLSVSGEPLDDCKSTAYLDAPLILGEHVDFIAKKRYSASGKETDITVEGEITALPYAEANTIISTTDVPPQKIEAEYFLDISKELAEIKAAILSGGGNV